MTDADVEADAEGTSAWPEIEELCAVELESTLC